MKTNHQRGFKAKNLSRPKIITGSVPIDPLVDKKIENASMHIWAPGRKGFRNAKKGAKQAGHAKVRMRVKKIVRDLTTEAELGE